MVVIDAAEPETLRLVLLGPGRVEPDGDEELVPLDLLKRSGRMGLAFSAVD